MRKKEKNMEIELKENERIDDLEFKNLKIIQNTKGFCFGIDAVLLSDFAKNIKKNAKVLDLGTGTGIISILLCEKTNLEKIVGVEVQKEVANMAKRSSKLNNLENKFEIINENIINLDKIYERNFFDVIVGGDMVEKSKPEPDIYLDVCEKMKINPKDTYAIEDSHNGVRSAAAAGLKVLHVPDMLKPTEEMEQLSYMIFPDLIEVREYLAKNA